jgi:hypothetical protein
MRIKQVSVFVQNQPGRLLAILEVMEKNNINLRALSISESGEFGIVRMIFPNAERGMEALREAGFTARMDWIISSEIPDVPGGLLNNVVRPLSEAGVNLKYFYAATDAITNKTIVVLKADDLDRAEQILEGK